ncbi:hypothetical protein [Nonomuraea sp. NPDC050691]|uniref:hypothetical protein n=1 Tax=Nonomuraea sp. NPDC050691 TaxID=3155661 RepID=UPI0033E98456
MLIMGVSAVRALFDLFFGLLSSSCPLDPLLSRLWHGLVMIRGAARVLIGDRTAGAMK